LKNFQISFISSISEIDKSDYQSLLHTDYPFIQYEFLNALESSGAVSEQTGWKVCHLIIKQHQTLIAFMPLYLKSHSYGEYVFDFEWAKAYQENGFQYYPKLLSAIPFTPVTGSRICHLPEFNITDLAPLIFDAIQKYAKSKIASSWHLLFPQQQLSTELNKLDLMQRTGVQFHWLNQLYNNFDDFLKAITSKRRKDIRRERKKVVQQEVQLSFIEGKDIDQTLWKKFYLFYQLTYAKRSGHGGYLSELFFQIIGKKMPENIVLVTASIKDDLVAASLFFKDKNTLYGRYWGCKQEYDFLHFEACYYQGIEYCIKHQLNKFDAGAQGEHKLQRGFEPVETWSNHWIEDASFSDAIRHHLQQEKLYTGHYFAAASKKSPYKKC